jgi:hypothetical protein
MTNPFEAVTKTRKKSEPIEKETLQVHKTGRTDRKDKVFIGGYFNKGAAIQLKIIGAEESRTNQELLEEALDLLFIKKGKTRF